VSTAKRIRPAGYGTETKVLADDRNGFILPDLAEQCARQAVNDGLVIVVATMQQEGRLRRRVYYSLDSAQRAADRAKERGHDAVIMLARLTVAEVIA
jgi:hypothetical protein